MLSPMSDDKFNSELNWFHSLCVENISNLLNETKAISIHEQFYIFCYLLWNGYFSVDKTYVYNNRDILDELNTIFLGRGCCRHNVKLLTEVLNKNNVKAYELPVHLIDLKSNMFDIKREIEYLSKEQVHKDQANHLVTLCKGEYGDIYLLDPTNPIECEIIKKGKLLGLNGKYKVNKKLLEYYLEYILYREYPIKRKRTTNKATVLEAYENAKNFCYKNKQLFEDYYKANHYNYEQIKRLILSKNN